jgi:hypothetical protein
MNTNTLVTDCIAIPTAEQGNINYYYRLALPYITSYIRTAQTKEMFGKEGSKEYYDFINNLYYLLLFISVVSDEKTIDINNGVDNPCSTYADEFICIINYFKCLNIDITPLLTVFGFTCTGVSGPGGIGIMEISNNSNLQEFVVSIPKPKLH